MKKFLFTLAALFMVGTAFAANVYVPDTEFTADQIGKQQLLPLYVELNNEYINGWEFAITYPEGVTAGNPKKNTAVLNQMIPNADGDEEIVTPLGDCLVNSIVQAYGSAGYWDPDDDGVFESYGAVKIGPDGTFKLYDLRVTPNEGFTGGNIVIDWMVSGGFDARNNQQPIQVQGQTIVHLTIPTVEEKEDCESPSIVWAAADNGEYYIQITPDPATDGALQYTVDVEPARVETVDGIVYLYYNRGEEDVPVHVVAWTAEGENYNASDEETADVTIPKLPQVATPEVVWTVDGNTIIINATCATDGATVTLYDPEGNAVAMPATVEYDPYVGYNATWTATATAPYMLDSETGSATITIAADEKTEVESPTIIGMPDDDGVHYNIYIYPGATDGELQYTANPAPNAKVETLVYTRGEEPYNVHVEAWTTEGPTCQASDVETADITVPALPQVATPNIVWSMGEEPNTIVIEATCDTEGATVTLYDPEGNVATNPAVVTYDPEEGYAGTWTAQATKENMLDSEIADKVIEIAPQHTPVYYEVDDPTITGPEITDEAYIYTVTAGEDDPNAHLVVTVTTGEGTKTYEGDGTVEVVIPRGEDLDIANINVVATVETPADYDGVTPGTAALYNEWIEPLAPKTATPSIDVEFGTAEWDNEGNLVTDGRTATITITNNDEDPNAVIEYSFDGETWVVYDEPIPVAIADGATETSYTVYARAKADNKRMSDTADETFTIDESTSVNELVNGKTVASKRFFNMAGQEMTEANGVTIVVTTYTDGTTSAVKVIK